MGRLPGFGQQVQATACIPATMSVKTRDPTGMGFLFPPEEHRTGHQHCISGSSLQKRASPLELTGDADGLSNIIRNLFNESG